MKTFEAINSSCEFSPLILQPLVSLAMKLFILSYLFGAILVMWMAAGFAMLEAGLTRSKNTATILTKNVALFAISCIMFYFNFWKI